MGPSVDDFEDVGFGRDDVEFAAVGLHEHLRGAAGELKIREQDGAAEIDDGEAILRTAHDEGDGAVGDDGDFVGLGNDFDGSAELERGGAVDGEGRGAAIDDEDGFLVRRDAGLDGLGAGASAAENGAGGGVDGEELVGRGGGGVDAVAGGGEVERKRRRADGNFGDDLRGARVQDEDVAAGAADAPDFGALGVLAEIGDGRADGNSVDDAERGEIDDGEGAVGGGDVSVEVEIGAEDGGAMLAEENDDDEDEQEGEEEVDAEIFRVGHEESL